MLARFSTSGRVGQGRKPRKRANLVPFDRVSACSALFARLRLHNVVAAVAGDGPQYGGRTPCTPSHAVLGCTAGDGPKAGEFGDPRNVVGRGWPSRCIARLCFSSAAAGPSVSARPAALVPRLARQGVILDHPAPSAQKFSKMAIDRCKTAMVPTRTFPPVSGASQTSDTSGSMPRTLGSPQAPAPEVPPHGASQQSV